MKRRKLQRLRALLALAEKPRIEAPPQWMQPGRTGAYKQGDLVTHRGKVWRSLEDRNLQEPGATGWEEMT